jgi:hypothetical protein
MIPAPDRKNFNLTSFLGVAGLTMPVGGNMMLVGDNSSGPTSFPSTVAPATSTSTGAVSSGSSIQVVFGGWFGLFLFISFTFYGLELL